MDASTIEVAARHRRRNKLTTKKISAAPTATVNAGIDTTSTHMRDTSSAKPINRIAGSHATLHRPSAQAQGLHVKRSSGEDAVRSCPPDGNDLNTFVMNSRRLMPGIGFL